MFKSIICHLAALLAIFVAAPAFAQSAPYKSALDSLFEGFKSKNYELLKPLLDTNVKIGTLPVGMNDIVVPQVLKQLPEPQSYTISDVIKQGDSMLIRTVYNYMNGNTRSQYFLFNNKRKIVELDIPGKAVAVAEPLRTLTKTPDRIEIPFELHLNLIFVKGKLNGKDVSFILDSGAPLLILNSDSKVIDSFVKAEETAMGVGGEIEAGKTHIQSFNWNGLEISDFHAMTMSLKHLEKATGQSFAGLIGYAVFKDYELKFDYKHKIITLTRLDNSGNQIAGTPTVGNKLLTVIPFELHQHIPVFKMTVGDRIFNMGLDCGASANLFASKYVSEMKGHITKGQSDVVMKGASQNDIGVNLGVFKSVSFGSLSYKNMNFAFEDGTLDQLNSGYGLGIDGLLGYEFLKKFTTTVNFKKNEIRVYAD